MDEIHLTTFGGLSTRPPLPELQRFRHALALLVYVACHHSDDIPRDELLTLLWDRREPAKARHSLSQVVYTLRKILPAGIVEASRSHLHVNRERVYSDYAMLRSAILTDDHPTILRAYTGTFLHNRPYVSDAFDDWTDATAAWCERTVQKLYQRLIIQAEEASGYLEAEKMARRAVMMWPTREEFARTYIETLLRSEDTAHVLAEVSSLKRSVALQGGALDLIDDFEVRLTTSTHVASASGGVLDLRLPFVGRSKETSRLLQHWKDAEDCCHLAVIAGEAGMGKTSLLTNTAKRLALKGCRVFSYSCSDVESKLPFSTLVGLLRDGITKKDVDELSVTWRDVLAKIAPEVFPAGATSSRTPRRIVSEAVCQLLQVVASRSRVTIAVDEYQWIDSATHDVLAYVARRFQDQSLFLLFAGRGVLSTALYEDDQTRMLRINVPQLNDVDVDALLASFTDTHGQEFSIEQATSIRSQVGGHPLFLAEVLRNISRRDQTNGPCSASLESYLISKIDALSPDGRNVLFAAATLSSSATLVLLQKMTGLPAWRAMRAASEVVEHGLLVGNEELSFRHLLLRKATLAAIPPFQRSLWHLRAAIGLGELYPELTRLIAVHYEKAGNRSAAFRHAKAAAKAAWRRQAFADAEEQVEVMLRCADSRGRYVSLRRYARLCAKLDNYQKLSPYLREMELAFTIKGDADGMVICAVGAFCARERLEVGLEDLARDALALLELTQRCAPRRLPGVLWQVGDYIRRFKEYQVMDRVSNAVVTMSDAEKPYVAIDMLSVAALLAGASIGYRKGQSIAHRATALAAASNADVMKGKALFAHATNSLWAGELIAAEHSYMECLGRLERGGPDHIVHATQANLAVVKLERGEFDAAQQYAIQALHEPGISRRPYSYANLALINLRRGDLVAVDQYIGAMEECHRYAPQQWIPVHVEALRGMKDLALSNWMSAQRRADVVEREISAGNVSGESLLHVLRARSFCHMGAANRAAEWLQFHLPSIAAKDYIGAARMELELARAFADMGEVPCAQRSVSNILQHALMNGANLLAEEARLLGSIIVPPPASTTPPPPTPTRADL